MFWWKTKTVLEDGVVCYRLEMFNTQKTATNLRQIWGGFLVNNQQLLKKWLIIL